MPRLALVGMTGLGGWREHCQDQVRGKINQERVTLACEWRGLPGAERCGILLGKPFALVNAGKVRDPGSKCAPGAPNC
jgi:hypothetical protein